MPASTRRFSRSRSDAACAGTRDTAGSLTRLAPAPAAAGWASRDAARTKTRTEESPASGGWSAGDECARGKPRKRSAAVRHRAGRDAGDGHAESRSLPRKPGSAARPVRAPFPGCCRTAGANTTRPGCNAGTAQPAVVGAGRSGKTASAVPVADAGVAPAEREHRGRMEWRGTRSTFERITR